MPQQPGGLLALRHLHRFRFGRNHAVDVEAPGTSALARNCFAPCGKGAEVVRHQVQCTPLPELMKTHGAPKVIDYLSLDLEQTESLRLHVLRSCSGSAKGRGPALHL